MKENEKKELTKYYNLIHKENEYVEIKYNNKETVTVNGADEFVKNIGYLLDINVKQIWSTPNGSTNEINDYFTDDIIDTLYCLIGDFDFSGSEHKSENQVYADYEQFENEHLSKLNDIGFYPSIIIHSGGGVHLYWLMDKNIGHLSNTEYSDLCEKAYQVGFADENRYVTFNECRNKSRCLRVPFTPNPKHNKSAEIVEINENVYSLECIESLFDREKIKAKTVQKPKPKAKRDISQIENDPKFKWIRKGRLDLKRLNGDGEYASDSEKDYAVCWYLAVNGWSDDQIKEIFEKYKNHADNHYFEAGNGRLAYLERTLDRIDKAEIKKAQNRQHAKITKINGEPNIRKMIEYVDNHPEIYTNNMLQLFSSTRIFDNGLWKVADENIKSKLVYEYFKNEFDLYLKPDEVSNLVKTLNRHDINHLNHIEYLNKFLDVIPILLNDGTVYYYPSTCEHEFKPGPANKEDIALFRLNVKYDKSYFTETWRNGGLFEKTITRFYDEIGIEALQYMFASVLVPNYEPDKVLIIYGSAGESKTTLINAFESLFNVGAISSTNLSNVNGRFQFVLMENSICNITKELSEDNKLPVNVMKALSGGESNIESEHKQKDKQNVKLFCKHIIVTNDMPKFRYDQAVKRRFMFTIASNGLAEHERDTTFRNRFIRDERGNLLRFIFEGLNNLCKNKFKPPKGHDVIYEEFAEEADTYTKFVSDCFEKSGSGEYVMSAHIKPIYQSWIKFNDYENIIKVGKKDTVIKEFRRGCGNKGFTIKECRPYVKKSQVRAYSGIRLKKNWFDILLNNHNIKDADEYEKFYSKDITDEIFETAKTAQDS